MKTKAVLLFCSILVLTACQPKGYTIQGEISGGKLEGQTVMLCTGDTVVGLHPIDSTLIHDGKFAFKGSQLPYPQILTLKIYPTAHRGVMDGRRYALRPVIPIFMGNDQVQIKAELDSIPLDFNVYSDGYDYSKVSITGSPTNDAYMQYCTTKAKQIQAYRVVWREYSRYLNGPNAENRRVSEGIDIVTRIDAERAKVKDVVAQFVKQHSDEVGLTALAENVERFTLKEVNDMLAAFPDALKNTPLGANKVALIEQQKKSVVGAPYVDLTLQTPEGKAEKLSDYVGKGKYVLLEFWASWCGPCRYDIPHLKEIYKLYHPAGFEIISISMDEDKAAWVKAVNDEQMPWLQISDLKAFKGPIVQDYNFNAIPSCVLVGPDGLIADRNCRGSWMDKIMVQLYGNKFGDKY